MKTKTVHSALLAASLALAAYFPIQPAARAADHGDAPTVAHDQAADIADVFFFRHPADTAAAADPRVIVIATFHGFIVPSEAVNFAIFDPVMRYRFEFYTDHVNDPIPAANNSAAKRKFLNRARPSKVIDITFNQREGILDPNRAIGKDILQIPNRQTATIQLRGFKGITSTTKFTAPVTNPSLNEAAPAAVITDLANPKTNAPIGVRFFAGEVDDPFFFDIPAFSRLIASKRTTGNFDVTTLSRARDSFAGYNILSIAFEMPASLLKGVSGNKIGVHFATQRHTVQTPRRDGEISAQGVFRTIDRMGNPAVNVALVPFDTKNQYNAGSPRADIGGQFAGDIVATLQALSTDAAHIGILASVAVAYGDLIILDPTIVNPGSGGGDPAISKTAGYPNGRRLRDDTVDIALTLIANGDPFDGNAANDLGDNVNASDVTLRDVFPFLAPPQQPRNTGVVDDNTRN